MGMPGSPWLVLAAVTALAAGASGAASGQLIGQRGQDPFRFPTPESTRLGGVILGTVIDATTGQGVPEAAVTLRGEGVALAIATDPLGRYYFVALPPGDYTITARKAQYGDGQHGQLRPDGPAQPLTLYTDEWRVDADVRLWRLATISGVVADEAGEGVVGVRVNALRREHTGTGERIVSIASELTDDRGLFRLAGLVAGEYLVMTPSVHVTVPVETFEQLDERGTGNAASQTLFSLLALGSGLSPGEPAAIGDVLADMVFVDERLMTVRGAAAVPPPPIDNQQYAYPTQYFPAVDMPALAMPVTVGPGEAFSGIAFHLRPVPTADIRGTVIGPAGPVSNQLLRLVPDTGEDFGQGFEAAATASTLDGSFSFRNVPSGTYVIEARSPRSLEALSPLAAPDESSPAARQRSDEWWGRTPIGVHAIDVEGVTVTMRPTISVAGQIVFWTAGERPTSRAIEGTVVAVRPAAGGRAGVPETRPIATGSFSLHGLLPSRYYLDVVPPSGWYVDAASSRGVDLTTEPLDASDAGESLVVAVRMTDVPTLLTGTVRDQRGFPASSATVVAFPAGGATLPPLRAREVRASSSGEFVIAGLPPGAYEIVAVGESEAGNWRDPVARASLRAQAVRVPLQSGEQRVQDLRVNRWR
jgi:hypothetical protein